MKYVFTDGRKSMSLSDLDEFMDQMAGIAEGEGDGTIVTSTAMQKVAFVYRSVRLIADAIRAAPFAITPVGSEDQYEDHLTYENKLGFLPDPKRINELVARALLGPGCAYLFRVTKGATVTDLRYVVPKTVKPVIDKREGLVGFERTVNGVTTRYPPERFVYFWPADETVEIGPPKSSPVQAALMAAGADYYTSKFISDFFARGAIKGTLLAVKGNPTETERNRLKSWFKRTFFGGSKTAFATEIINADAIEPVKIGEGLEALNNSELTKQMREDIAVALGVPVSKLMPNVMSGLGGGAAVQNADVSFYQETVMPLGEFVADTFNQQLYQPLGYTWRFLWDSLDVFQQEEKERAIAFKTYVGAGMEPGVAAMMLGIEIPDPKDVPDWYADVFSEPPQAQQEQPMDKEQAAEYAAEREEMQGNTRSADLDKWERFATKRFDEGHPEKALEFESAAIDPTLHAAICGALEAAETADEAKAVFAWVGYP